MSALALLPAEPRPVFAFEAHEPGADRAARVLCDGVSIYRRAVQGGAVALGEELHLEAAERTRVLGEHAALERADAMPVRLGGAGDTETRRPEPCRSRYLRARRGR